MLHTLFSMHLTDVSDQIGRALLKWVSKFLSGCEFFCFQVRLLPEGAIQVPESSHKPLQGRIEKPLAGSSGQSWTNRVGTLFEL